MDDADRNSDEQIRGVEQQIREVEQHIRSVEEEVRIVQQQIQRLEEQIETCSNLQEKAQLRRKDEQLRREKAQLRRKDEQLRREKAQLRGEKAQLREEKAQLRGALLTKRGWLQQTLLVQFSSFGPQPGPRGDSRPRVFMAFWDIFPAIDAYVVIADHVVRRHRPFVEEMSFYDTQETTVLGGFRDVLLRVGRVVLGSEFKVFNRKSKSSRSSSRRAEMGPTELAQSLAAEKLPYFDLVVSHLDRRFLVVEMKRPAVFRTGVDVDCPKLGDAIADLSTGSGCPRSEALVEPVYQIYNYMLEMNLGYGIISSLDVSYFIRRVVGPVSGGETLEYSEAVTCGSPRFLGAVAFVLDTAAHDQRDFNQLAEDAKTCMEDTSEDSSEGLDKDNLQSEDPDDDRNGKANDVRVHGMVLRKGSGSQYKGLREIPAEHLHLAAHPFATGWSGRIVRGTYEGHPVAVKLAPFGSDRAEALLTEIAAYDQLRRYWGKYVPKLISYGTTAGGQVVYIATEFIDSREIGMGTLTLELEKATFDALDAVHESGILHGDIRCSNILVVKRGQRGVRLIDFGFSRPITSSEDCKKERAQLKDMLEQFSGLLWSRFNVDKIGQLSHRGGIGAL